MQKVLDEKCIQEYIHNKVHLCRYKNEKKIKKIRNDTFGTICFKGFGQEAPKNAPYIRVDKDAKPAVIWELMMEHWNMPEPRLIISVTGGAKHFYIKPRLLNSFKRGLIKAATTAGAWITTGGTQSGVMAFVGEAVKDYMMQRGGSGQKIIVLGIATWGIVANNKCLTNKQRKGFYPCEYNINDVTADTGKNVAPLDPNHTHFIMVDDGTSHQYGGEILFRAQFEKYRCSTTKPGTTTNSCGRSVVPVVLLVLEGGENTIKTACEAMDNGTPVVVIEGTGRAADFIAYAYKAIKCTDDKEEMSVMFDLDIKAQAKKIFHNLSDIKQQEAVENVIKLLRPDKRDLLTIFRHDDENASNDIDKVILNALLRANSSNAKIQLDLALAWKRCDVAKEEIFSLDKRAHWKGLNLNDAMHEALVQDKPEFVSLFLDIGVELKKFLTVPRLKKLYEDVLYGQSHGGSADMLRNLMQEVQQSRVLPCYNNDDILNGDRSNLLEMVGRVINHLTTDQRQNV